MDLKNNIYWRTDGKDLGCAGKSWDEWRAMGRDEGSIIADPKFVDPDNYDFRFASDEVIKQIGFQPFDYSQPGVYGDPAWIALAKANPIQPRRIIMTNKSKFIRQSVAVLLACGLIASVLAGAAGGALPANAGQRFTDDFAVPSANWRYGGAIRSSKAGGLALSARAPEATLAGTAVNPDNLSGFAATFAWNTGGVTDRTLAIGWGKSAEWAPFDECTERIVIGADGAVMVSAGGITLGTARIAVSAGGDAVLAFRRSDDAITVMADSGDIVFRLPAGKRTAAGYLAVRVQGGAENAAPLVIRRVTIDCAGDRPPLTEAERAASNDRWAAARVRRNNVVLDTFERYLRAEAAAGRWGFPTDLAVSPGLVLPGERVRIVFRCKGELPEPCTARLEPDYLGGSSAAVRPVQL